MSQFSGSQRDSKNFTPTSSPPNDSPYSYQKPESTAPFPTPTPTYANRPVTPNSPASAPTPEYGASPVNGSPTTNGHQRQRSNSRPLSMVQAYQPPLMDINQDTIPELQPIFTFLNSHANKLYQEGYFLKLDDQNTRMCPRPSLSGPDLPWGNSQIGLVDSCES
jgi:CCR4-NOT transcriptional complex subunit CAF120